MGRGSPRLATGLGPWGARSYGRQALYLATPTLTLPLFEEEGMNRI